MLLDVLSIQTLSLKLPHLLPPHGRAGSEIGRRRRGGGLDQAYGTPAVRKISRVEIVTWLDCSSSGRMSNTLGPSGYKSIGLRSIGIEIIPPLYLKVEKQNQTTKGFTIDRTRGGAATDSNEQQ